jgi:hypothetical protein
VYAKDQTGEQGKAYSSFSSQRILLDYVPPKVIATFSPLTLSVKVACDDGEATKVTDVGAGKTLNSGCKSSFAYISDLYGYSQALFRGPQNAALVCPPYQTMGQYVTSPYSEISTANSNEVRVMCIRQEDNAGNAGVTMVTVYNSYDMLAKAIALAVGQAR